MLKMEVFDLEINHNLSVVMIFSVEKLSLFFIFVNISSCCKCHLLQKIKIISLNYLYGYQFATFCEI